MKFRFPTLVVRKHGRKSALKGPVIALLFLLTCAVSVANGGQTSTWGNYEEIKITEGINHVNLTGHKDEDVIVKAWRENYNAHGYFVYLVMAQVNAPTLHHEQLELVGILDEGKLLKDILRSAEESDECMWRDVFFVRDKTQTRYPENIHMIVIDAKKEGQPPYDTSDRVNMILHFYNMEVNQENIAGWPYYYFNEESRKTYSANSCDRGTLTAIVSEYLAALSR